MNFIKSNVDILKNRTIILDNARIHHYNKVKQFAIENNIILLFNTKPDKSPKYRYMRYNPVNGFHALKKEKAEAKDEMKRVHMLNVATVRLSLLRVETIGFKNIFMFLIINLKYNLLLL